MRAWPFRMRHGAVTLARMLEAARELAIGVLVFEGAEELDYVGPWEVLAMSSEVLAKAAQQPGQQNGPRSRVTLLAEELAPVRSAKGLVVVPHARLADSGPLDVLVVPGGRGVRRELGRPAGLAALARAAAPCSFVASVCTGSALLVAAGLADGRRVTTHWAYVDTLRATGRVDVQADARYVCDGRIVTAAGVSAGIDMSLWLIGQLFGIPHAREVSRQIEYDPAPPYGQDSGVP